MCFSPTKKINILVIPDRSYSQRTLGLIMCACIILHNMIIDDKREDSFDENYHIVSSIVAPPINFEAHSWVDHVCLHYLAQHDHR
jgi:hypothetical protein